MFSIDVPWNDLFSSLSHQSLAWNWDEELTNNANQRNNIQYTQTKSFLNFWTKIISKFMKHLNKEKERERNKEIENEKERKKIWERERFNVLLIWIWLRLPQKCKRGKIVDFYLQIVSKFGKQTSQLDESVWFVCKLHLHRYKTNYLTFRFVKQTLHAKSDRSNQNCFRSS